jgi:hypothetical protein
MLRISARESWRLFTFPDAYFTHFYVHGKQDHNGTQGNAGHFQSKLDIGHVLLTFFVVLCNQIRLLPSKP